MSNPKNASAKVRDKRPHEEKLQALRECFGEAKEKVKQSGKINDCSLTKIAKKSCVDKSYLTGNKVLKDKQLMARYRKVGKDIVDFRNQLKEDSGKLKNESTISKLEVEIKNLKDSFHQEFMSQETLKSLLETRSKKLQETQYELISLRAQIARLPQQGGGASLKGKGLVNIISRTIVSPEKYFNDRDNLSFSDDPKVSARYKAFDHLNDVISRPIATRLYILVGLPFSGKSTWAKTGGIWPDRHAIIFDAINLKRIDRYDIVHRISHHKDIKICVVFFDMPMEVICERNKADRDERKQISDEELLKFQVQLEIPNPVEETWIDELIVIRLVAGNG